MLELSAFFIKKSGGMALWMLDIVIFQPLLLHLKLRFFVFVGVCHLRPCGWQVNALKNEKKNLLCPDLHEFNNSRWPHTYESESKIFTDPVRDKEGICLQDSFILEVLHVTQLCGCFFYKAIAPLGSIDLVWLNMSSERK